MDFLAYCLAGLFFIAFVFASIYILVCAFRRHILWGLGYMFVPFVGLVYIVVDWRIVWKAFLLHVFCIPLMILSMLLSPSFRAEMDKNAGHNAATTTAEGQDDKPSTKPSASSPPRSSSGSVKHHHRSHH